jgi:hypothetical protein
MTDYVSEREAGAGGGEGGGGFLSYFFDKEGEDGLAIVDCSQYFFLARS